MIPRRHLLAGLAGISALGLFAGPSLGLEVIDYTGPELESLTQSGTPYLIDFYATWCVTCAAQQRVLDALQAENAAYRAIPILRVDWDTYGNGELARNMTIPRRSTLVLMRGTTELGRLVAETGKDRIAELLDLASS
ncbi:thioredoxin family protein [Devosia sp. XJ19-1]|uniref:Thioredoxin family protein n=1 Tax=Devosia ureilytica TaxID=2952754 RepID=A0A9Q4AQA7_9HYPH|nr:thioredoxin family protein [Devosia ureilytica]MCP8884787.1 thioredoxin family protein [Devosia ureilytica]MCP8888418.1 thioredoxin family protein [Devosia ureilytica]